MLKEVLNEIGRRDRFLLTSHARPDGDAVGSVLACWQILRQLGKEAQVVMADPVPVIYRPLPFADSIVQACEIHNAFDAAIILECDSVQRTRLQGLDGRFLINIDHHSSARPFAHINWIDPTPAPLPRWFTGWRGRRASRSRRRSPPACTRPC